MPMPESTAPEDVISWPEAVGYSSGLAAVNCSSAAIGVLINPIFNITLGLSPAVIGVCLFVQRLWNVTVDPFAGYVSDNLKSAGGRRRPLILATAAPLALSFAAIWLFPRGAGPAALLGYLVGTSLLFYSVLAFYSVPLLALGMEASRDYHERTRLNVFARVVSFVFLIGIQWAFPFIQWRVFPDRIAGVRCFAAVSGLILAALASMPLWLNREARSEPAGRPREPFLDHLRSALRNPPFIRVVAARTVYAFSYNLVGVLGLYLNYYYVFHGDIRRAAIMQGWNGTIFQVAGIGSLFLIRRLAIRRGKREAVLVTAGVFATGCLAKLFVYSPAMPWLQVVVYVTNGISAAGMTVPTDAMLPDIVDQDERLSGARREGMYASVLLWFDRVGYSVGTLFSGFLLGWIGFDVKLGGAQPERAMDLMRYAYCAIPLAGACAIFWVMARYPLTAKRCYATRAELDLRRLAPAG
jgi:GPH family glycoside/pentoside/hexuronide:cation symporter